MATDVVGSKMPSLASDAFKPSQKGYGQNNYGGASSDLPGQRTTSGYLPDPDLPGARALDVKLRNRKVDSTPIKPAFGMDQRSPRGK